MPGAIKRHLQEARACEHLKTRERTGRESSRERESTREDKQIRRYANVAVTL
jgi:hypothetical protein